jgi:hypothetical protein
MRHALGRVSRADRSDTTPAEGPGGRQGSGRSHTRWAGSTLLLQRTSGIPPCPHPCRASEGQYAHSSQAVSKMHFWAHARADAWLDVAAAGAPARSWPRYRVLLARLLYSRPTKLASCSHKQFSGEVSVRSLALLSWHLCVLVEGAQATQSRVGACMIALLQRPAQRAAQVPASAQSTMLPSPRHACAPGTHHPRILLCRFRPVKDHTGPRCQ